MTEKRFRVFAYNDGSGMYGVSDDIAEYTVAFFDNHLDAEGLCDLLNEQHESIQFLKEYDKILQGQRIRLVNFLKEKGYSIKDIKGIMNDDKYLGRDLE